MRRAKLANHLSSTELQERYLKSKHLADRVRWHALWLISTGKSGNEAASLVGRTSGWASLLVRSYNERGEAGVVTVKREGRQWGGSEASLRWGSEEEAELREALQKKAADGGLWTAAKVASWLSERRGRKVHPMSGWRTLKRLRQSKQLPRPQHPEAASPEEQVAYRKKHLKPSQL